tara:strand:+ start:1674 stop:2522 length:849 start_codon:yes stop_codon:yes gene_type:complete
MPTFVFDSIIVGYPHNSLLSGLIDKDEDSVGNVIRRISEGSYNFKQFYPVVIVFSVRMNKYYVISSRYNLVYMVKKYMELVTSNNDFKDVPDSVISDDIDEKLRFISSKMDNLMNKTIYTIMVENDGYENNHDERLFDFSKHRNIIGVGKMEHPLLMYNPRMEDVLTLLIHNKKQMFPYSVFTINNNIYKNVTLYVSRDPIELDRIIKVNDKKEVFDKIMKYSIKEYIYFEKPNCQNCLKMDISKYENTYIVDYNVQKSQDDTKVVIIKKIGKNMYNSLLVE